METTAENSTETAPARPVGRPFPKGVSGNAGGRPKGLARRIRDATNDGDDLVAFVLDVFTDEAESTKMRMEAATWLADRGFGKRAPPPVDERRSEVVALPETRKELLAELAALEAQYEPKALRAGSG